MAQYDIDLREYWRILKKRKLIIIVVAVLLGSFSTIFSRVEAPTPLYSSTCSIKFEKETTLEGLYAKTISWNEGDDIETQMAVITGYSVMEEAAKNIGLSLGTGKNDDPVFLSTIEGLKAKVTVAREQYTNILNIIVTDTTPESAQRIANEVAAAYKKLHAEQQDKRTIDAINYIEAQLTSVRQNLKTSEEAFNTFAQENQLLSIDKQSENILLRKKEIKDEERKLNEQIAEIEALVVRIKNFIKTPSSSDTNFFASIPIEYSQYESANNTFVELLLKKESMLQTYTAQHPQIIEIELTIMETAKKMVLLLGSQLDNLNKKISDLNNEEFGEVDRNTNQLMEKKLEYDRLKREVESVRERTALLETKNQEAQIKKAEKPEEVVIVKPALPSSVPINPPKTIVTGAMGVVIGLVLGLILAFVFETFDTSLGAIEDVEKALGAKVLGVIPHTDAKEIMASLKKNFPRDADEASLKKIISLVAHFAPKTMISENFRALRTNIQSREGDNEIKTMAVTSTSQQEGKTMISVNLAISLAQAGIKTLLVGADLRKPMLAKIFGIEETPGLTDIVLGNYVWRDTVKTITDIIMGKMTMDDVMLTPGMDNLNIITSGSSHSNPSELLESERFLTFINEAKKEYDIIIFDSSPVISTADAAILGQKVDGVLIVYRVGVVSQSLLKRTATQLEQAKCNIIGIILNGMKPDISPDFQDFKYYRYYSYGNEKDKGKKGKGYKGVFSFIQRKGKDWEKRFIRRPEKKSGSFFKGALIIGALLLLAAGILYQNGMLYPWKKIKGEESINDIKKPQTEVKSKTSLSSPASTEDIMSDKGPVSGQSPIAEMPPQQTGMKQETPDKDIGTEKPAYESGAFPFSVYLGSFRTREKAEQIINLNKQQGIPSYSVTIAFKDQGVWLRIYAGHFKDREQAESYIEEHGLKDAEVKGTPYANLIGSYNVSEDLKGMIQSLNYLGYSSYTIDGPTGGYYLFVGAFITMSGAEEQNIELKSAGIESRVVKR